MAEEEAEKLLELFQKESVEYKLVEHEPVCTSEQAPKVRNAELKCKGDIAKDPSREVPSRPHRL